MTAPMAVLPSEPMGKLRFSILVLAGCGRFGFDPSESPAPDAPPPPPPGDSGVDPPRLLACGQPVRFMTGALDELAAAPTSSGFVIAGRDETELAGWSYAWQGDALAATADHKMLDNQARTVGAASVGDDVVIASVFGANAPAGTTLYPVGGGLAERGQPRSRGEI